MKGKRSKEVTYIVNFSTGTSPPRVYSDEPGARVGFEREKAVSSYIHGGKRYGQLIKKTVITEILEECP